MGSSVITKIKVGITTCIALGLLIGGILWVKEFNPATQNLLFTVRFSNGQGIAGGDPITISGIKVGEVRNVSLTEDNKAEVILFITKKVNLSDDCTFTIRDVGLMGDKMLVITPGTSTIPLDPTRVYTGADSRGLTELIESADAVMIRLDILGKKLDNDLDIAKLSRSFEQTFEKIQQVARVYETLAEENRKPLKESISNLNETAGEMQKFMKRNDTRLADAIDSFQKTTVKIGIALDNFNNLSSAIDTVSTYIESGEGSLARLIKSDALYEELRRTNATIDSFVTDFKTNPGKYTKDMKFRIRLF